jgi:beta-phosphoglucomutase-like phosphatase (HAD superfamily)
VEDALKGLRAAKAAGMACAIIRNRYNRGIDFRAADIVFRSYAEFSALTSAALGRRTEG